jgi:hypothetical protein
MQCRLHRHFHVLNSLHHAPRHTPCHRNKIRHHPRSLVPHFCPHYLSDTPFELSSTSIGSGNSAIRHDTIPERIAFYHTTLFSPSIATWCHAIDNGHFTTWPDLTSSLVRKHAPKSVAMIKGHLDQQRANQHFTQPTEPTNADNPTPDDLTAPAPPAEPHFSYPPPQAQPFHLCRLPTHHQPNLHQPDRTFPHIIQRRQLIFANSIRF